MRRSLVLSTLILALAATAPVWAQDGGPVDRAMDKASGKMDKAMNSMSHAMGMEKWSLKVVERDRKLGKPTLERGIDDVNTVERKTTYYSNGKIDEQQTRQFVGSTDVVSYIEKKEWDRRGKKEHEFVQTMVMTNGAQTGGDGSQKDYKDGRVVNEIKRRWTVDAKAWKDYFIQTVKYYADGDKKERITEETDSNAKTRESWGKKKSSGGRNKSTQSWNGQAKRWD